MGGGGRGGARGDVSRAIAGNAVDLPPELCAPPDLDWMIEAGNAVDLLDVDGLPFDPLPE